jgi:hypothetical protein
MMFAPACAALFVVMMRLLAVSVLYWAGCNISYRHRCFSIAPDRRFF